MSPDKVRDVTYSAEQWKLESPFRITGHVFHLIEMLHVKITENGSEGHGEAAGVYYLDETGDSILADAEAVKEAIELGADRETLRQLLPAGGARNAIDCALWDLEAKLSGKSIWDMTGIAPQMTQSFFTVGIDTPEKMAAKALSLDSSKLKVKLDGKIPFECISAVRGARPDAEIIVDVNQGWTFAQLVELAPKFRELNISMIEQPLPRGGDQDLEGYDSPVPLCADESCLTTEEFEQAARRYQVINIKLDKTGGLTEALDLARMARSHGKDLMIGNMVGTSLGMAPGYVIAQLCKFVDLDGTLYLNGDREHPMTFEQGFMSRPESILWG
tara:strand:- start:2623 stop:3612 length:990 start_codon:yes stop_codon:yes gene_type:complete